MRAAAAAGISEWSKKKQLFDPLGFWCLTNSFSTPVILLRSAEYGPWPYMGLYFAVSHRGYNRSRNLLQWQVDSFAINNEGGQWRFLALTLRPRAGAACHACLMPSFPSERLYSQNAWESAAFRRIVSMHGRRPGIVKPAE